jgi:DNA-binding IscR family transcriptional regulator
MFIINRTDRYRLEALMELANSYPESRSATQVAARRSIPSAYLSRLLSDLTRAGWLRSRRGPGGGVTLARPPEAIPVAGVLSTGGEAEALPPALARLADTITTAVDESTVGISIADLARWERQISSTADYSI